MNLQKLITKLQKEVDQLTKQIMDLDYQFTVEEGDGNYSIPVNVKKQQDKLRLRINKKIDEINFLKKELNTEEKIKELELSYNLGSVGGNATFRKLLAEIAQSQ